MKTLRKLKLNRLNRKELNAPQMKRLKGGKGNCWCGCCYDGLPGGSDQVDNGYMNCKDDLTTDCPNPVNFPFCD